MPSALQSFSSSKTNGNGASTSNSNGHSERACLYCQISSEEDEDEEEEEGLGGNSVELWILPQDPETCKLNFFSYQSHLSGELSLSVVPKFKTRKLIFLSDSPLLSRLSVEPLFETLSKCASLHPSTDGDDGGMGNPFASFGAFGTGAYEEDGAFDDAEDAQEGGVGEEGGLTEGGRVRNQFQTPDSRFQPY